VSAGVIGRAIGSDRRLLAVAWCARLAENTDRIRLFLLPANSPESNPDKRLNQEIKSNALAGAARATPQSFSRTCADAWPEPGIRQPSCRTTSMSSQSVRPPNLEPSTADCSE
jgi:hypothetical protein